MSRDCGNVALGTRRRSLIETVANRYLPPNARYGKRQLIMVACSRPPAHNGPCAFHSRRWFTVRAIVRAAVALAVVGAPFAAWALASYLSGGVG